MVEDRAGRETVAQPSRAHGVPTRAARTSAPRSAGARGKGGAGRSRPDDFGAHALSGRSGSVRAAKKAGHQDPHATVRGAGSSGEVRGATLGVRPAMRVAGAESRGTRKIGARRGSSKSRAARRARV